MAFTTLAVYVDIAFDNGPLETTPTWTELAAGEVGQITIQRGRQTSLGRVEAGRCTVILPNQTRRYDPTNTSSPEYGNGYRLEPGKRIRVRVTLGMSTQILFTGNVTGLYQQYDERGQPTPELRIEAVDGFGYFGTRKLTGLAIDSAFTSSHIASILQYLGWPLSWYSTSAGSSPKVLAATTYSGTNALEAMQAAAAAERGILYMRPDGVLQYQSGSSRQQKTSDFRFLILGSGSGETPYLATDQIYDHTELYNLVRVTPSSGTTQTAIGTTAGSYFEREYNLTVPLQDDADGLALAQEIAGRYQYPRRRATRVTTTAAFFAESGWFNLLNWGLYDLDARIGIRIAPPVGAAFVSDYFVDGVRHDIAAGGRWALTYTVTPATYYTAWTLEDAVDGLLDQSTYLA